MNDAIRFLIGLGILITSFPAVTYSAPMTGRDVMQKVINRDNGDHKTADMEMVLIDKNGSQRIRKIRGYSREFEEGRYSILFFLEPADVKNTGFLTYDYKESKKDDDQWLYLPALRKTKRIAGSDQSGSFMGSDFNYSDMTEVDIDEFDYRIMKEPDVDGVKTWQIEAVPKNEDVAADTGYAKSVLFVRQDNFVPVRSVLWVHKSKRRKFMEVHKLEQIEGIWVALESQMTTKEGSAVVHSTYLRNSNILFNQKLGNEVFPVRQLEKGLSDL